MTDAERTQVELDSCERSARELDWLISNDYKNDAPAKAALAAAAAKIRTLPTWSEPVPPAPSIPPALMQSLLASRDELTRTHVLHSAAISAAVASFNPTTKFNLVDTQAQLGRSIIGTVSTINTLNGAVSK